MSFRKRAWAPILFLAVLCAAAVFGLTWWRGRALFTTQAMFERLPDRDAALLYVDFSALRRSGLLRLLNAGGVGQERDYRAFVEGTGFDYTRDLDRAAVAFTPAGTYFVVRGHFDWKRLREYAAAHQGSCRDSLCNMPGSTPERNISFLPLGREVMALAVTREPSSAAALLLHQQEVAAVPAEPLWLAVPGSRLVDPANLPEGTRLFASGIAGARRVLLALAPTDRDFQARLEVLCRSAQDAAAIQKELERATGLLRETISRENRTPNPLDLTGVLAEGSFRRKGDRVLGAWPVRRAFLEQLLAPGAS